MTRPASLVVDLLVLIAVAPLVLAGCAASAARGPELPFYVDADLTPTWTPSPSRSLSFSLTTQTGQRLTGASLAGRIHIATFLYTRCNVICPILVGRLQPVHDAARDWPDVHLVSFSVAPQYDTVDTLAEFGRTRGIDPARWTLLTGDARQIQELARTFYFADDPRLGRGADEFLHTEKVLLVDQRGRLRGVYNGTQRADIERLMEDVAVLRRG